MGSELTGHQAFRYGRGAYGFLFHLETTEEIIEDMVQTFAAELEEEGIPGRDIVAKAADHLPELRGIGDTVFSRWAGLPGETE